MKPTTRLLLALRISLRGTVPPLPHVSAWRGAQLSTKLTFVIQRQHSLLCFCSAVSQKLHLPRWRFYSGILHQRSV